MAGYFPLSMELPNGIQNDVMSWLWASGGSMMADGQPNLVVDNDELLAATMEYIKGLYDAGRYCSRCLYSMREPEKVEEFTNGRVGMMVDSLAHINLIRERKPRSEFCHYGTTSRLTATMVLVVCHMPRGESVLLKTANTKAEAWKLVAFLMSSADNNSQLSSIANAFPGNVNSTPDFVETDELFADAFAVFQEPATWQMSLLVSL